MSGKKTPQPLTPKKSKTPSKSSAKQQQQIVIMAQQQQPQPKSQTQTYLDVLKRQMLHQKTKQTPKVKAQAEIQLISSIKKLSLIKEQNSNDQKTFLKVVLQKICNTNLKSQTIKSSIDSLPEFRLSTLENQLYIIYQNQTENNNPKNSAKQKNNETSDSLSTRKNILKWIQQILKCQKVKGKIEQELKLKIDYKKWIQQKQIGQRLLGKLELVSF